MSNDGYKCALPLPPDVEDGHQCVVVKIIRAKNLKAARIALDESNPFIDMRIHPTDERYGSQEQKTSYKPKTLDPLWSPYERFQIFSSNPEESRIIFSAYHKSTIRKENRTLGDSVVHLRDMDPERPTLMNLKLVDPSTGSFNGGEVEVELRVMPASRGVVHREDVIFEYQRYQPIIKWGSSYPGHLLPTDPGRYSNANASIFASSIDEICESYPEDWKILEDFHNLGDDTWEYAVDFPRSDWYQEAGRFCYVRRRAWFRVLAHDDYSV